MQTETASSVFTYLLAFITVLNTTISLGKALNYERNESARRHFTVVVSSLVFLSIYNKIETKRPSSKLIPLHVSLYFLGFSRTVITGGVGSVTKYKAL